MAVKRKKTLAPPIYRTGGKDEHYSIELLLSERELILERIKSARQEMPFNVSQRKLEIARWSALAAQLHTGIFILRASLSPKVRARIKKVMENKAIMDAAFKTFLDHNTEPAGPGPSAPPPGPPPTPPAIHKPAIASCKHFAKCGNHSYWYCFSKCKKRKTKECTLVRKYTRRKGEKRQAGRKEGR